MNRSINFYRDLIIGVLYISGVFGLASGEIITSMAMIGAASLISTLHFH